MGTWPPITREDLRHAAGTAGFDTMFPLLIRRLIAETGDGVTKLDMPGGSGTAAGGFDGVVTATGQTTFVPGGTSVWELSVGGGNGKADEDFGKRTEGPDGLPTREVTYVEVILAPWTKARGWSGARTQEGRWKEVRAYNLDRVHAWLDHAPATTAWLAEQLGKAMPGVLAAETWWSDAWLPSTRVPLDAKVVLAGREAAANSLRDRLIAGERFISLGGELRPEEAWAVVAASLEGALGPEGVALASRTLFVSDSGSFAQLIRQTTPLILVLTDVGLAAEAPVQHSHQLILLAPPGSHGNLEVPPVSSQILASYFEAAGVPRDEAWSLGTLGRRSVLALRRALAWNALPLTPSWAFAPGVILRRLLLIGAWDGANDADRVVVEQCVGHPYKEVQEAALALASAREVPFLGRLEERWHVLSPDDAWTLLGASLTADDLDAFKAAVLEVLGEKDPSLDLEEGERWKAAVHGVRRRHSASLRAALVQSLALLSVSTDTVRVPGSPPGAQWVNRLVGEILRAANSDETYKLWASLDDVLPLLAEAAPEAFLQALSEGLDGEKPLHARMFLDAESDQFGNPPRSPHLAFLRALEVLAWSPDYFDEVIDCLARLAALDPGGKWSNRPAESVAEILSSWRPNTTADLESRQHALDRLLRLQPPVARRLLIRLIPDGHGYQHSHEGPRFKGWKDEAPVPSADTAAVIRHAIDLLLDDLDDDPDRYEAFIERLPYVADQDRADFTRQLKALGGRAQDDDQRSRLFEAIRKLVASHREHSDAAWALPEAELTALESAGNSLQPADPVLRYAWLFASDWVTLGDISRRDDYGAYESAIRDRRVAALHRVIAEQAMEGVEALAQGTDYPGLLGSTLAVAAPSRDTEMLAWLGEKGGHRSQVAFGYVVERLRTGGATLAEQLLAQAPDALTQARVLRASSDPPWAWGMLRALAEDVARLYWKEFTYFGLGRRFAQALDAARSLQQVGRNAAALDLLMLYGEDVESPEAAELAATALEALLAGGLEDPELSRLRGEFERLFALLARHREHLGRQRVVHIEWQLFPALGFDSDAPTLHEALAEDPAFFAELVSYVFRPDSREGDEDLENRGDDQRARSIRAFEVLSKWRRCPGVSPDGSIDLDALRTWVASAREFLAANDRTRVGGEQIGKILAFAPPDPDGMYPPRAIRDLLEELREPMLEEGLYLGISNSRGVTSRGALDGGEQERELAARYREQADAAAAWPRTRKLLNALAESLENTARWQDSRAEALRRGLE